MYTTNLGTCLWLQGRLDEAEERLRPLVKDREDATSFRYSYETAPLPSLRIHSWYDNKKLKLVYRTGYALLALGNVQISQALALTQQGEKEESEAKHREAMETHLQSLKLYELTIGPRHHHTADACHKVAWHLHQRRQYVNALYVQPHHVQQACPS